MLNENICTSRICHVWSTVSVCYCISFKGVISYLSCVCIVFHVACCSSNLHFLAEVQRILSSSQQGVQHSLLHLLPLHQHRVSVVLLRQQKCLWERESEIEWTRYKSHTKNATNESKSSWSYKAFSEYIGYPTCDALKIASGVRREQPGSGKHAVHNKR